MYRGHRYGVTKTKIIEFIEIRRYFTYSVTLVYAKHNRLAALLEHCRNICVIRRNSRCNIGHEYDNVRLVDSKLCLHSHLRKYYILTIRLYTTGINKHKLLAEPLRLCVYSVTGNARCIIDYRHSLADNTVKKCGFTDIRSSYNRYYSVHLLIPSFYLLYNPTVILPTPFILKLALW